MDTVPPEMILVAIAVGVPLITLCFAVTTRFLYWRERYRNRR